jgi:hypothetical protein
MNYTKYNRAFVMLEEQNSQFAAKGAAPVKGYLKVETGNNKGALRCVVQNLKYFEKGDYIYKLILFGKKAERTIHTIIGNLTVNRQGNGETYFRFLPLDIDGKGGAYHYYTTAIVAAASTQDSKESLHPVLKGVTRSEGEPFPVEQTLVDEGRERGRDPENGQGRGLEDIISKIDKIVGNLEETLQDETLAEGPSRKENPAPEPREAEAKAASVPGQREEGDEPKKLYNGFYNEYVLNACAHTCRIAEFYEEVKPFDKDRTGARWKKIVNITNLPLVSPGAHYFATQYRHYIFGAKPDENGTAVRFFFGVPGRFLEEEQPDGGKSGFTCWQPIREIRSAPKDCHRAEQSDGSGCGYWIVAVDGKTGDIEEV